MSDVCRTLCSPSEHQCRASVLLLLIATLYCCVELQTKEHQNPLWEESPMGKMNGEEMMETISLFDRYLLPYMESLVTLIMEHWSF